MPFVKRNDSGTIIAVSQERDLAHKEEVSATDPALKVFIAGISQEQSLMAESDLAFVRVVEDIVDLLVEKHYILFTELPQKAQEKMEKRQEMRGRINNSLDLLSDEDETFNM